MQSRHEPPNKGERNESKEADMIKKERNSVCSSTKNPLTEDVNICLPEPFETNYHIQLSFAVL
jgi:hypothetical protein